MHIRIRIKQNLDDCTISHILQLLVLKLGTKLNFEGGKNFLSRNLKFIGEKFAFTATNLKILAIC